MIRFSTQHDSDEFERMTTGLMPIDDFAVPDELIEAGFIVQQSIELNGTDGRKYFCTAYIRQQHRVVMVHSTEASDSDALSGEAIVYTNADWAELISHWM